MAAEVNIVEGILTGADDYLVKPFGLNELKARVANMIEQRQKLREKFMKNLISADLNNLVSNSTDAIFLNKVISVIEKNIINTEFGVTELASELAMGRSNLYDKLKKLSNEPPGWFILSIRLKLAAQMLKSNHGNVSEVACAVGFTDTTYFIRTFKKRFGVTPGDYRG
jgi:AraC-like DNA-binding protein